MKQLNFQIDENDLRDLGIAAREEDLTVSQVLRGLVKRYLLYKELAKKLKRDRKRG